MQVTAHIRALDWQRMPGVVQIDLKPRDALALGGPRFDLAGRRLARYQRQVSRPSDEHLLGIGSQVARAAGMVAAQGAGRNQQEPTAVLVANGGCRLHDARH